MNISLEDLTPYTSPEGYIGWFEYDSAPPSWKQGISRIIKSKEFLDYLYYPETYLNIAVEQTFEHFKQKYPNEELEYEPLRFSEKDLLGLVDTALENDKDHFTPWISGDYCEWDNVRGVYYAFNENTIFPEIDIDELLSKLGHPSLETLDDIGVDEYFTK